MSANIPLLVFMMFGIWLSWVDLKEHRLPNKIVFACFSLLLILIAQYEGLLLNALRISIYCFMVFILLFMVSRNSLGMGDVKFSLPCGLIIGYYAPHDWLLGVWLMFALAGLSCAILMIFGRLTRFDRLAFGPYMALSTFLITLNSLT